MATFYRVCVSTRRIAIIDAFPAGNDCRYHVEVFDIDFHDDGLELSFSSRKCAEISTKLNAEWESMVRSLGLEWFPVLNFLKGAEILIDDYEERLKSVTLGEGDEEHED